MPLLKIFFYQERDGLQRSLFLSFSKIIHHISLPNRKKNGLINCLHGYAIEMERKNGKRKKKRNGVRKIFFKSKDSCSIIHPPRKLRGFLLLLQDRFNSVQCFFQINSF